MNKEIIIISMEGGRTNSILNATIMTDCGRMNFGELLKRSYDSSVCFTRSQDYYQYGNYFAEMGFSYTLQPLVTKKTVVVTTQKSCHIGSSANQIANSFGGQFKWVNGNYDPRYNNRIFFNAAYVSGEKIGLSIPKWEGPFNASLLSTIKDTKRNDSFVGRGTIVSDAILSVFGGLTWLEATNKYQKRIA